MAGFAAEIAYYLDHHLDGLDPERLERLVGPLRRGDADGARHSRPRPLTARRAMLESLEFMAYPDVAPLRERRELGLGLVVTSNWDCSLPSWLRQACSSSWTAW